MTWLTLYVCVSDGQLIITGVGDVAEGDNRKDFIELYAQDDTTDLCISNCIENEIQDIN